MDLTTRRITDPKEAVKHFKSTVTVGASQREEQRKEILDNAKPPCNVTNDALSQLDDIISMISGTTSDAGGLKRGTSVAFQPLSTMQSV